MVSSSYVSFPLETKISMDELMGGRVGGAGSPRHQEAELIFLGPGQSLWPPQQRSTPVWLAPAPV